VISKNWPEKIFAGIADQAGNLASRIDQNKRRRVNNALNVRQIIGTGRADIHASERRTVRVAGFWVDGADFVVPALTPRARLTFEHHQLSSGSDTRYHHRAYSD